MSADILWPLYFCLLWLVKPSREKIVIIRVSNVTLPGSFFLQNNFTVLVKCAIFYISFSFKNKFHLAKKMQSQAIPKLFNNETK
jgi:hypothetical protein